MIEKCCDRNLTFDIKCRLNMVFDFATSALECNTSSLTHFQTTFTSIYLRMSEWLKTIRKTLSCLVVQEMF